MAVGHFDIGDWMHCYRFLVAQTFILNADHFTPAQDKALREAIAEINALAGRELKVIGHNEVNPSKGCPSFNVQEWLADKPEPVLSHPDPAEQKPTGIAALLTALIALVQGFLSRR